MQAGVANPERFEEQCDRLWENLGGKIDPTITSEFLRRAQQRGLLDRFNALLDGIGRRPALPDALRERPQAYRGSSYGAGHCGCRGPRTRSDHPRRVPAFPGATRPERRRGRRARPALVRLPGCTGLVAVRHPYKPFTFAEEAAAGEDHYSDFRQVLRFLNDDVSWHADVAKAFEAYREALVRGEPCADLRAWLRDLLLPVMCRTERPSWGRTGCCASTSPWPTTSTRRTCVATWRCARLPNPSALP
ncbi:hypothetical protein NKG94_16910 [Micromonospora sp. M12]